MNIRPKLPKDFPKIVCLCGSTRFSDAFKEANLRETITGNIVLSIGCDTKSDKDLIVLGKLTQEAKDKIDELFVDDLGESIESVIRLEDGAVSRLLELVNKEK